MKNTFLLASAAALILSTGALAQDANAPATVTTDAPNATAPAPATTPDATVAAPAVAPAADAPNATTPAPAADATAAAPAEAKTYPVCSAKLKDNCINRGAKRRG